MTWIHWTIIGLYFLIGIWSFFWIRRDAEFRAGSYLIPAIFAIFAWPFANLIWMLMRGDEHITDMAAKQSTRDFQAYMRTKTDKDLFVTFPHNQDKRKDDEDDADEPRPEVSRDEEIISSKKKLPLKDSNVEGLIEERKWAEAEAAARSMKRVAIQMEDHEKAYKYDEYLQTIEEGKMEDIIPDA